MSPEFLSFLECGKMGFDGHEVAQKLQVPSKTSGSSLFPCKNLEQKRVCFHTR